MRRGRRSESPARFNRAAGFSVPRAGETGGCVFGQHFQLAGMSLKIGQNQPGLTLRGLSLDCLWSPADKPSEPANPKLPGGQTIKLKKSAWSL